MLCNNRVAKDFIHWKNADGNTVLHCAANYGYVNAVQQLIRISTSLANDMNINDEKALHRAVKSQHFDIAALLLPYSLESEQIVHYLYAVIHTNLLEYAQVLMAKEIHHAVDVKGASVLHLAVLNRDQDTLAWLLKQRINPEIKDNEGNTGLHLAVLHGYLDCLQILVKASANVNATNNERAMALHLAARSGNLKMLRWLLTIPGIDTKLEDNHGKVAWEVAMLCGHVACAELLLEHSCHPAKRQAIFARIEQRELTLKSTQPLMSSTYFFTASPTSSSSSSNHSRLPSFHAVLRDCGLTRLPEDGKFLDDPARYFGL